MAAPSGGGGGGSSRDSALAEARDTTKLPAAKGEDGRHEKAVPLPAGFLSIAQAGALVSKRPLIDAALSLG